MNIGDTVKLKGRPPTGKVLSFGRVFGNEDHRWAIVDWDIPAPYYVHEQELDIVEDQ